MPINSGLATVLGAEGYLTTKINRNLRSDVFDKVLYDTSEIEYRGHYWEEIEHLFPEIKCYKVEFPDPEVDLRTNSNAFYWLLCMVALELRIHNNNYCRISLDAWEKAIFEYNFSKMQYKNLLFAYISLTWDSAFLYLYQCLEDRFSCESVRSLHKKLALGISEQELSRTLYDELSWQPKDIEGLLGIIQHCDEESTGLKLLRSLAGEMKLEKWIYSMRNRIVHETRDALIPLDQDEKWEGAIAGMLYILKET